MRSQEHQQLDEQSRLQSQINMMADQNRQLEGQMAEQGMQRARVERQLAAELQQAHMLLDEQAQVMRCAAAVCCIVLLRCRDEF